MATETATFALKIDADAEPAKEAAAALEKFRAAIDKSQSTLTAYRKSLQLLKGDSDEVKDAKAKLKVAIEAEKAAITKNNLEILKLGGSYDKLSKAHRKATDVSNAGKKAIQATGGPLKDISARYSELREVLSSVSSGYALMAVASVAAIAGVLALGVATVSLISHFSEWIIVSGDALRNMQIMREAASGNAANATAWGHQIDWLSLKLATSKDALNAMVVETEKAYRGTRISGKGMVDAFTAVAEAGAAAGDDVGRAIDSILQRGKLTGRFSLGFKAPGISELQGTGLAFNDVAGALAKNAHVSIAEASKALVMGRVTLDAGAKAVKDTIEKRFGSLNAEKLISLGGIFTKLSDNVRDWTQDMFKSGGALEPILQKLKSLVDLTGLQTESGQKAKQAVTAWAQALADGFQRNWPLIKQTATAVVEFGAYLIQTGAAIIQFVSSAGFLEGVKIAILLLKVAVVALAIAFAPMIAGAALAAAPFLAMGAAIVAVYYEVQYLWKSFQEIDWGFLGKAILNGIEGVGASLKNMVGGWADTIKDTFKDFLGIHSPSAVFKDYGKNIVRGYAQGIDVEVPKAQAATAQMVMPDGGGQGPSTSTTTSVSPTINVEFHINGQSAQETAHVLKSSSIIGELTHAFQVALKSAGIPTGILSVSGGSNA